MNEKASKETYTQQALKTEVPAPRRAPVCPDADEEALV